MKIMVFTEGTILMHKNATGHAREEIVQQVKSKEPSVCDFASYVPVGEAVKKVINWKKQGAEIIFLTSRRKTDEIESIRGVLKKYGFPDGQLLFRHNDEKYNDVVEQVIPDILIEDNCESIGGTDETIITHVNPKIKRKIKSIVVKEFGGINYLPDNISTLLKT